MTKVRVRDDLNGQHAYGAPQLDVPVRLNVNENPFPPSPELVASISQRVSGAAARLNRYPDRDASELRTALATYIRNESGGEPKLENIWVANGSNEVMHHLLAAFGGPGRTCVTFAPTYSMYVEYCRETFTEYSTIDRNQDFTVDRASIDQAIALHPDIIIVCSPNNPTGTVVSTDALDYLIESFDGLIIVDEAYAEFRPLGTQSAVDRYANNANVVITRTMSKAFSCAGLRVGYAIAHADVVQACMLVRLPYHLSAITQAAALAALDHSKELLSQVELLRQERELLAVWLKERHFDVAQSGANFLLFGTFADRQAIWQGLLDRGILIRQTGPEGWLRVSIGTPQENEMFKSALEEVAR